MDKLFGSRTRAKLLGWFFSHSGESYSDRQLASILGDDPSNLSKEMSKLEDLGILISSRERNLKRFQVNQECAFGPEILRIAAQTGLTAYDAAHIALARREKADLLTNDARLSRAAEKIP